VINLLPPNVKEDRAYGRRNISMLIYSGALLGTAVTTAAIMIISLQFVSLDEPTLNKKIQDNQVTISALEKNVKTVEDVARRLETAAKIRDQSIGFSELLPKIGAVLPEGVVLNSLSLTGGATDPLQLEIDLTNANLTSVMIKNLVESDLFEAADITSLTPLGTGEGGETIKYQFTASITASFTGTAEAKQKAEAAAAAEAAKKKAAEAEAAAAAAKKPGGSQ
jgi:Tfp pilus assembly protein PilN